MEELLDPGLGDVRVFLMRDDNKPRKLKYNLDGVRRLLVFGGAYSNLVRAAARAGAERGVETIGIIRGEERLPLNWSLRYAADHGMTLAYMDRATYRLKHTPQVLERLRERWGDVTVLPEGASNAAAVRGCAELPADIPAPPGFRDPAWYDLVCCPVGTGGTLAGIAAGLPEGRRALGFAVLKGAAFLNAEVAALQQAAYGRTWDNWSINLDYHFGGYARSTPELDRFAARHRVEGVYVAKMLYGVLDLARRGAFAPGTRIVAVVTAPPAPAHPSADVAEWGAPTGFDSGEPRWRR